MSVWCRTAPPVPHGRVTTPSIITRSMSETPRLPTEARLLDAIQQAVIATDLQGRVTYWNAWATHLFGWTAAEAIGQDILRLTPTDTSQAAAEEIMARLTRGEHWAGDFPVRRKDGSRFTAFVVNSPILDADGNLFGVVGVSTDVSATRELEAQLRQAQKMEAVGRLAGGVAHDFNNLLTVIHTNAELAAADVPATSAAGESLTQLLVASRRAREVVRQILTFSRRTRTHRSAVRIEALLTETQSLLRAMIPSTVQVVFRDDAPGAVVEGDATQLQQLLLNLCSNAEYAMRATNGGTLTVQARWEDHAPVTAVRLSVTDTGVGIPADVRARMFEPFFTTKPVGEGTGLGLSVLHGIVGAHGGTITVTSELGHGSTFDVVLPAHHADDAASQEPPVMAPAAAATRRILLVDDEPAVMKAVQRTLQRRGYEVETASNGAEALERLRTRRGIDLVITDQTMPVMTGTELIEQLRADGLTMPVILASGFGAAVDRARIDGSGDVWRMDKPFATDELLAMVSRAMAGDATPAGSAPASPPPSV